MDDLKQIAQQFLHHHSAQKRAGVKLHGAPALPPHILKGAQKATQEHLAKIRGFLDAHEADRAKGLV